MIARCDAGVGGHCHTDGADEINGYIVFVYGDWWWCFHGVETTAYSYGVAMSSGCVFWWWLFMTLAAKESGGKIIVFTNFYIERRFAWQRG